MPAAAKQTGTGTALAGWLTRWLFTPLVGITFSDWLRLVSRHGLGIPPQYWPRTLFTGAASLVNSPLAAWEARRYRAALAATEIRAPVFVLGHHRSGTTHLWNLLATHPQFVYPSVLQAVFPHTFLTVTGAVSQLARRVTPRRRPQDNVDLSPDSPIEEERAICASSFLSMQMGRHFPRARARYQPYLTLARTSAAERRRWQQALDRFARKLLITRPEPSTLLFKSPDHTGKIRALLELYPDARFIHIHRHPYQVFQSTRRMELTTQPLYAYQPLAATGLDDFILWRYRVMYEAFFEALPAIPAGQFAEVGYDELVAAPEPTLERLYRSLDLGDFAAARAPLRAYLARIADYRTNRFPDLDTALRARIASEWAPCFAAWGYPT